MGLQRVPAEDMPNRWQSDEWALKGEGLPRLRCTNSGLRSSSRH